MSEEPISTQNNFMPCKMFGVRKLVFVDETNNTFDVLDIDTYDTSNLR